MGIGYFHYGIEIVNSMYLYSKDSGVKQWDLKRERKKFTVYHIEERKKIFAFFFLSSPFIYIINTHTHIKLHRERKEEKYALIYSLCFSLTSRYYYYYVVWIF